MKEDAGSLKIFTLFFVSRGRLAQSGITGRLSTHLPTSEDTGGMVVSKADAIERELCFTGLSLCH